MNKSIKLKFISKIDNGFSMNEKEKQFFEKKKDNFIPYVSTNKLLFNKFTINLDCDYFLPFNYSKKKVEKNSVLLCIEGASAGEKLAYSEQEVYIVNKIIYVHSKKVINKYLLYIIAAKNFKDDFFRELNGLIGGVSITKIKNFKVDISNLHMQNKIVNFLDDKIGKIDKEIKRIKKQIKCNEEFFQVELSNILNKNKEKNLKLKYCLKAMLQYGANESGIEYSKNHPRYIRITDIDKKGYLYKKNKQSLSDKQAEGFLLDKKDILFARSGATVGKTYMFNEDYSAAFAGYLIRAKIDSKVVLPEIVYYYTKSYEYNRWKDSISIQSTIENIGAQRYNELNIPIIAKNKQEEVLKKILEFENKINKLNEILNNKIELLEELKKSLINEAVTGKIKIGDEYGY